MTIDGDKGAATALFNMLDDFALFFNVVEP